MYWDRSVRQVQAHKIFLLIQSQCRSTNCRAASRECHKQNFPKLHNYMKSWKNSNSLALLISFLLYREGISFLKFDISSVQGIIYIMSAPEAGRKVCVFSSQFCHGFSANSFYNSFLQFIHQITTKKIKKIKQWSFAHYFLMNYRSFESWNHTVTCSNYMCSFQMNNKNCIPVSFTKGCFRWQRWAQEPIAIHHCNEPSAILRPAVPAQRDSWTRAALSNPDGRLCCRALQRPLSLVPSH